MKSVKPTVTLAVVFLSAVGLWPQNNPRVSSPSGLLQITFSITNADPRGGQLVYDVAYRGKPVLVHSILGMNIQDQRSLGSNVEVDSSTLPTKVDDTYTIVAGKSNPVRNLYNAIFVNLREPRYFDRQFSVEVRAYDDGVAFRYVIPDQSMIKVFQLINEQTQFQFSKDASAYPLILRNYQTAWEDNYHVLPLSNIHPDWLVALPLLAEVPGVAWVAITEADIDNYAGMYLQADEHNPHALRARLSPRVDVPGISVIRQTPLHSPWRVIMVADDPGRLIESNIVINLNPGCALDDTSWIKPGKAAWDWWSSCRQEGTDCDPSKNTATIEHYIDFASKSGFEYMLIDGGWAAHSTGPNDSGADLAEAQPDINMHEILDFARSKNVGVWLWAHWVDIDRQMDEAFPMYEKWGIAGVKIDFMNRNDQWMVDFYRRVVKKASGHHLMIDFHGAFMPDGLRRTYPNLLTQEGVLGLEYNKWSADDTPDHHVMIAFSRMLAGPLDFTPGGFRNVTRQQFEPRWVRPMVMGTRAHQTALFVVLESPLEVVADSPEAYADQKELAFLTAVPTSWDETRVLNAKVGDYVTIARRRGASWYIGSIAGWHAADLDVPLNFLGAGQFIAEIYSDAADAAKNPTNTTLECTPVTKSTILKAKLVPGGGQAVRIQPANGTNICENKQ